MNLEFIKNVPSKPGIYMWKDNVGDVIYVGKAKNLKIRLSQYIKGSINSYKTTAMMDRAKDFEYILTKTNKEALLLERNFIAKYKPEFNILLMDDKNYPYIMIQLRKDGLIIRMVYKTKIRSKNIIYFGPFPTGYGAKRMADLLNRITVYEKGLPRRDASKEFWEDQFSYIKKLISNQSSLISEMKLKMKLSADQQKYEIAHDIKETLNTIKFSKEKQAISISNQSQIDVIAFFEKDSYLSFAQLFYRQGNLLSLKSDVIEIKTTKKDAIRQFTTQFYSSRVKPEILISNVEFDSGDIKLIIPTKGEKKQMLEIALTNARENIEKKLSDYVRKEEITIGALKKLKTLLGLKKLNHILMIDNSNTANINPVSAIVSYRNGVKNKSEYKRFKLLNSYRNADVEYMRQGVKRYFSNKDNPIPDLFIVDGGISQFNEIKKIIPNIPLIGLVKDEKHATESMINLNGEKVAITDVDIMAFFKNIQIEVDRFAKSLHRKINIKKTLDGKLLQVDGVGQKTEEKLLKHFKSYSAIHNASVDELSEIVSFEMAKKIKEKFNK